MRPITNDAIFAIRMLNDLSRSGLEPEQREKVIQAERYIARVLLRLIEMGVDDENEISTYLAHSLDLAVEARNGSVVKCVGCPWAAPGTNGVGAAKP